MMKTRLLALLLCVAPSLLVAAEKHAESGSAPLLRWASQITSNAPFSFYDRNNRLTGFEYEIICGIAHHMGREPKLVQNSWDGLIPGLGRGLYDCVICGIEITADKGQEVLFSNPYYTTYEQLVVAKGTPPVQSLAELSGRKVGTIDQTAALKMLQSTPNVIVKTYTDEVHAYDDVVSGRLYGVLLDFPIAKYYGAPNPSLEFTGPPFGKITYGIAVSRSRPELVQQINTRTGAVARIFDRVCDVLTELEYLKRDSAGNLTPTTNGSTLARIYGDRDLLVAEALRRGIWVGLDAPSLAAMACAIVFEPRREEGTISERMLPRGRFREALNATTDLWAILDDLEHDARLPGTSPVSPGLSLAMYKSAQGTRLDDVLFDADMPAGDFVRWTKQTIDLLDQLSVVADGDIATNARKALDGIRRGVVAYSGVL